MSVKRKQFGSPWDAPIFYGRSH